MRNFDVLLFDIGGVIFELAPGFAINKENCSKELISLTKKPYYGALEFLKSLSENFYIASFYNTNPMQWHKLSKDYSLGKIFQKDFLSYKMGMTKQNKEVYSKVIKQLGCKAERILFFDDNQSNVDMAIEAGIKAYRATGIYELKLRLEELGIIDNIAV